MPVLMLLVVGTAVGFIATRVLDLKLGVLPTIAIGVLGAVIGGLVFRTLVAISGALSGVLGALIGAVLLVWLLKVYQNRRK